MESNKFLLHRTYIKVPDDVFRKFCNMIPAQNYPNGQIENDRVKILTFVKYVRTLIRKKIFCHQN